MDKHPLNLALRFGLELAALYAVGRWAWQQGGSLLWQWLFVLLSLAVFMGIWVTFNVPNDPSRSGKAPVVVRGWLRLLIELILFGSAVLALFSIGSATAGWVIAGLLIFHYAISYERIIWLLKR